MSDFAQTGLIGTLQRLNDRHLGAIEAELEMLAAARPIALVLPCHAADLDRPALRHIVDELCGARFLAEIVVSANGLDAAGHARALALFSRLPQPTRILWNDQPGAAAFAVGRSSAVAGKGANVAGAFAQLVAEARCKIFVTQDCDVASFRRADLARLCFAVAHPQLGYRFAKMYYSRATDRLYGRVSRLFLAPLLQAILRVAGHQPMVDFLLSFRYPLAGEVALTRPLAATLPASAGWSLEIAQLCEVFRRVDPREVCQVDGGAGYDHKHQPAAIALTAMAAEIARELFRQLAAEGFPADAAFRSAVAAAYRREADHALTRSAHLALINALPFDGTAEREMVIGFSDCLGCGEENESAG